MTDLYFIEDNLTETPLEKLQGFIEDFALTEKGYKIAKKMFFDNADKTEN